MDISKKKKSINQRFKKHKYKNKKIIQFKNIDSSFKFNESNENNIAIIIPYKNNEDYLEKIKIHFKNTKFDIYIIEQCDIEILNRGYIFNIGYYLAKKNKNYKYYIFSDIYFLPDEDLLKQFNCEDNKIIHYTPNNNNTFLGGIIGMSGEIFEKINGYPNKKYGVEIDNKLFYNRIANNYLEVYRPKKGKYILLENPYEKYKSKITVNEENYIIQNDSKKYKYLGLKEDNNKDIEFILLSEKIEKNKELNIFFYKVKIPIQHLKHNKYISLMRPLITWKEVKENILDTYTEPELFKNELQNNTKFEIFKKLINDKMNDYTKYMKNNKYTKKNDSDKSSYFSKKDLEKTLKFIYDTYQSILYLRIRQNHIEFAFHIYNNENFKSDWYKYVKFPNNMNVYEFMKKKQKNLPTSHKIEKIVSPEKWTSHDCVVHFTDFFPYWNNYVKGIYEMFIRMIQKYKNVPDCDLLINNKDFHYLHVNPERYSFTHVYPENVKIPNCPSKYWFICSQSTTKNNLDIPIPSADEFEEGLQKKKENLKITNFELKENKLFFRGATTGCGLNENNNSRLRLCMISEMINLTNKEGDVLLTHLSAPFGAKKDDKFFDIGLSRIVSKSKVNDFKVGYINEKKYKYLLKDFVNMSSQKKYKYLLDIEGNVSAYRLPLLFSYGSIVVHAESDYYMWFEPLLEDGKDYILLKKEVFMKEGDSIEESAKKVKEFFNKIRNEDKKKLEKIAENGLNFYKKYLMEDSILDYCYSLCYQINKKYYNVNL